MNALLDMDKDDRVLLDGDEPEDVGEMPGRKVEELAR